MLSWIPKLVMALFFFTTFVQGDDDDNKDSSFPDFPTSKPPNVKCEGNESVADPDDCHQFYQCYEGVPNPVVMTCGGLWFNPEIQECDWAHKAPDGCDADGPHDGTKHPHHHDDDDDVDHHHKRPTRGRPTAKPTKEPTDDE